MGFLTRLRTGLRLASGSISVLRDHPRLFLFPVFGGVAGIVFVVTLLGGAFLGTGGETGPILYATLFGVYLGSTFIASFFTAALMHATRRTFDGGEPDLRESLGVAWDHKGPLFVWALISAVVGIALRALEESNEIVARIIAVFVALGWAVMTYFVVPVIVFEDVGVGGMFKRSGGIVRDIWGESLGAETGVSIVTFLLVIVGVLAAGLVFVVVPTSSGVGLGLAVAVGTIAVVGGLLIGTALTGIAKTALYIYATEDEAPSYFAGVDFGR